MSHEKLGENANEQGSAEGGEETIQYEDAMKAPDNAEEITRGNLKAENSRLAEESAELAEAITVLEEEIAQLARAEEGDEPFDMPVGGIELRTKTLEVQIENNRKQIEENKDRIASNAEELE